MEHGVQYSVQKIFFVDKLEWRTTKLVRGWNTEERLMELGLYSPEKQRFLGGAVATF